MNKQHGYYNIDFAGIMIRLLIFGIVFGIIMTKLVSWAWPFIKAFIHAVTA